MAFSKLDQHGYARPEFDDIVDGKNHLVERGLVDGDHVGITGGSYGGYMVLASAVHYSDRLKAAVDVVGISNFVTFLENTQDYRRDLRRAEAGGAARSLARLPADT